MKMKNLWLVDFFRPSKNPTKKDWVTTVKDDLEYLDMKNLSSEEIRKIKKPVS
jgi:hypothetical protein